MDKELQELKTVLRSLVVSSPAQMDVRSLARDYHHMMGGPIPLAKYGYREVLPFLKERFGDCFVFQGLSSNPVLTLIVPDSLKHIDQFVQRQKCTAITKMKGKRRSVETPRRPPENPKFEQPTNLISQTFRKNIAQNLNNHPPERRSNYHPPEGRSNYHPPERRSNYRPPEGKSNYCPPEVKPNHTPEVTSCTREMNSNDYTSAVASNYHLREAKSAPTETEQSSRSTLTNNVYYRTKEGTDSVTTPNVKPDNNADSHPREEDSGYNGDVRSFFKKRLPMYDIYLDSEECREADKVSSREDNDSGRQTSSSQSSTKKAQLEELKCEVLELVKEHENGIMCTDIMRLYRERYGRELNLSRFGHHNINSLLSSMEERVSFAQEARGVRVRERGPAQGRGRGAVRPPAAPPARAFTTRALPVDPDDALPGIDFEPDVFPADCVHFMESIPALPLGDVCAGAMLEVCVGEVYSPSHFWLQRLGPAHSEAMDDLMDEMSVYYNSGAGRERVLARGAVRPGHYCASVYERDWHRSLIVKIIDADTVKVRHVDYGTVDAVDVGSLKPLLSRWAALPAQAQRARLAGLRPGAGGRRWPHAAAAHFLALVRDRRFVANVVALEPEEDTIETFLIDTSGADDVCVSAEMIRAGHADARPDSALRSGECYLYPRFEALESGATPNYGEIHRYLADGISLEYVEAYRRHVPAALPAAPPAAPPPPPAPTLELLNRVPLLRLESPPRAGTASSPAPSPSPAPAPASSASSRLSIASAESLPAASSPAPRSSPAPLAASAPAPAPAPGGAGGEVRLSLAECDMYTLLNALDPAAAHCYMLSALRRAAAAAPAQPSFAAPAPAPPPFALNPQAPEFRNGFPPMPGYDPLPPAYGPLAHAYGPLPPAYGPLPPAYGPLPPAYGSLPPAFRPPPPAIRPLPHGFGLPPPFLQPPQPR